jgi:glycosyltransferase involved in cell wall biosynthesis
MVTTFFGSHSFGGDAAYVDRLSRALIGRGHEVHVYHCADAFNAVRGNHPLRSYAPPPGLHVHRLESPFGLLSPLATQVTGRPLFKAKALVEQIEADDTDVVHFHNISLVGGPAVLKLGKGAFRLMTAHEHWLICPMHLLWKYDRGPCDSADCVRCCLAGRRPPQLWRYTGGIERNLAELDALIFPSRHALEEHQRRGVEGNLVHLPYFLPDDWPPSPANRAPTAGARPYIAAAGRLVKMKGFQRLIPLMRQLPDIDLRIAGTGPFEPELRTMADGLPNVSFEGLLGGETLARLFQGARAVVVPSLFPETFGYVVLEAFAVRTPVIVHRGGGAIAETGEASGGGLGYETETELLAAIRALVDDAVLRNELAEAGYAVRWGAWSESSHIERYFELIDQCRGARTGATLHSRPRTRVLGHAR